MEVITDDKRIRIIAGHYGSGKTEFAINYAVALSKMKEKVALADVDVVNVYFRSRERKQELEDIGIEVISSSLIQNNCDIPAISARVFAVACDPSIDYVVDVGGNDVGILALARLIPYLTPENSDFFMVVNTNRPDTSSVDGILKQKESLEKAAGMSITGFVLNTNLIHETTSENIIEGNEILQEVSRISKIPIRYTSYVEKEVELNQNEVTGELFAMKYYMREEWY